MSDFGLALPKPAGAWGRRLFGWAGSSGLLLCFGICLTSFLLSEHGQREMARISDQQNAAESAYLAVVANSPGDPSAADKPRARAERLRGQYDAWNDAASYCFDWCLAGEFVALGFLVLGLWLRHCNRQEETLLTV